MSSYRPNIQPPRQSQFSRRPPPPPPQQPPPPSLNWPYNSPSYTQTRPNSSFQQINYPNQAQQNPQYPYQSPPSPMFYQPSQHSRFRPRPLLPLQLPLPLPPPFSPCPSTFIPPLPPPPQELPPPPPPPLELPFLPPPPLESLPSTVIKERGKGNRTKEENQESLPMRRSQADSRRSETDGVRRMQATEHQRQEKKRKMQSRESQKEVQILCYKEKVSRTIGSSRLTERTTPILSRKRKENRLRRPTSFVCKMKFRNELPDLTAQGKILPLKRDPERYTRYNPSIERLWKPEIYVEKDLGIPLDLLDLSVYNPPKGERLPLDPADEELLRDDDDPPPVTPLKKDGLKIKKRPDDKSVSWLVKTQYISPINGKTTKKPPAEKHEKGRPEALGRHNILQKINDRESKIKEIEASFEACKSLPIHATNKELYPVEILPLLPDFDRYKDQFLVASFDSDPTADSETYKKLDKSARKACESRAILKSCVEQGSVSAEGDKYLAYLAPSPEEMSKDIYDEDEDVSYSWVRNYYYNVLAEDTDDPKTFLVSFDENDARYLPLPKKFKMKKKKASKKPTSKIIIRPQSIAAPVEFKEPEDYPVSERGKVDTEVRTKREQKVKPAN